MKGVLGRSWNDDTGGRAIFVDIIDLQLLLLCIPSFFFSFGFLKLPLLFISLPPFLVDVFCFLVLNFMLEVPGLYMLVVVILPGGGKPLYGCSNLLIVHEHQGFTNRSVSIGLKIGVDFERRVGHGEKRDKEWCEGVTWVGCGAK